MIIANEALCASLAIYHLISNARSWKGVDKTWTPLLDPPFWTPFWPPSGPPSGPLNFFGEKKIIRNYKVILNMCATYLQPPLLSHFSFLRFSVQLERTCSPSRNAFPSSRLVFPRGIRNLLAISYLDNFRKTCHFQVARNPAIFRHLSVSADQYQRGALLARSV